MAAPKDTGCNLVQQLFEQQLGLLRPLPDAVTASNSSSEFRQAGGRLLSCDRSHLCILDPP